MSALQSQNLFVSLLGQSVEVALHQQAAATDTILLLHEALGSVSYWKDFPEKLSLATGANVLLYSRAGHGNSEGPLPARSRESYLREAQAVIPALLDHFQVNQPIIYGHSEGAGLAMLVAATTQRAKMLILESPYVVALEESTRFIQNLAGGYQGSDLQERLQKYHREADAVFASWIAGVEALRENRSPFAGFLEQIHCPVLVLQGADDDFGTTQHLQALLAALPGLRFQSFPGAGHLPHRQNTEAVLERVSRFVATNG